MRCLQLQEKRVILEVYLRVPPSSVVSMRVCWWPRIGGHRGILLTDTQPGREKSWGRTPADRLRKIKRDQQKELVDEKENGVGVGDIVALQI